MLFTPLLALAPAVIGLIIVGGIIVCVWLGAVIVDYFSLIKVIGVSRPCLAMFVGGTDSAVAVFVHKPRYSRVYLDPSETNGTMELFRIGDMFELVPTPPAGMGRLEINTRTQPVVSVTAIGLQPGEGEIQISGVDEAQDDYTEYSLPVIVMAASAGTLALYRRAASRAGQVWSHGGFGNFATNFFGGARKGLCDQWAEWTAQWLKDHNDGTICRIDMCIEDSWYHFRHQFVRITMCETGEVFYVDPHKNPDDPIVPRAKYEDDNGTPEHVTKIWER